MGDAISGNGSMNIHLLSQHDWYLNNGYVSCGNVFINSHTLYQYNYSSNFKEIDGYVENSDVSGGRGYMNTHTIYK